MKVKIKLGMGCYAKFSSEDTMIMIELTEEEKNLVSNMRKSDHKFCTGFYDESEEEVKEFMR